MKHKMLLFFASLILISLTASKCKKEKSPASDNPYGLPNATQIGANIFACLINGQEFIAYNDVNHIGAGFVNDTLIIAGQPKNKNYLNNILLKLVSNRQKGLYIIDNFKNFSTLITDSTCNGISFNIYQFNAINGFIQLTKFDSTTKIVSGLFNCIIPIPNCDTLKITDGRFDIIYH